MQENLDNTNEIVDYSHGIPGLMGPEVLNEILNKIDQTALMITGEGDVIFCNDAFQRFYKLLPHQTDGRKVYDPSLHLISEEHFRELAFRTRDNGGKLKYEETFMLGGTEHTFEMTIIYFHVGKKEFFIYLSKDMTELRRTKDEAVELSDMLNIIIDNLPVYLFVKDVDDDLHYLIWNKAFEEYSKIPAEKVIGKTDFEVFPDYRDAQEFRDDDLRVIESGELTKKHESYVAADGLTRIVQTYKALIKRKGKGPLLVGISLDITNIQGIEEELIRERLRAEESDRLKTRFLANMSHEIRTPLNAIVGFAGMLPDVEDEETRKKFIDIINENSELLLQLINDILDLSKIEAGTLNYNRTPMDLYDTCKNYLLVYKDKVHDGVKLIFDNAVSPSKFIINEDRNRIMQVLDNLIGNAVKFTESGEVHYGFYVNEDWIEVYVSDTGKGIPADKLDVIFDRFVKLDNFVSGTGLGLSICKLIVETIGGKMSVSSEVGVGSTFKFTIPYHKDKHLNPSQIYTKENTISKAEEPEEPESHDKDDYTILVAEDVYSNYLVVKTMIKGRYNLLWARDGEEAVKMAIDNNPDLIFMDIKMPIMDGMEATREIRKLNKKVPIVAVTANAFDEDRIMAQKAGMNNFISKPINRDAFEAVLMAFLPLKSQG